MTAREKGFLLLSSLLGDSERKPLSTAQLRTLADRSWQLDIGEADRELEEADLLRLGYSREMAARILDLLSQEDVLAHYLNRAHRAGCTALTRVSPEYPLAVRKRLGTDSPGVLWAKGDTKILHLPKIALVGSRELTPEGELFAKTVGLQAARQGFALVSGNARGADRCAQNACLNAGGKVICVVADALCAHHERENVLYLSEGEFDSQFSAIRALSRNRVIHTLGEKTFVAQCSDGTGGTWDGTVKNLRFGWSDVFCHDDGSQAVSKLAQMGAVPIGPDALSDFAALQGYTISLFG